MKILIYVEGANKGFAGRKCREAFLSFLQKAVAKCINKPISEVIDVVPCGARAIDVFGTAIMSPPPRDEEIIHMLLVDSEVDNDPRGFAPATDKIKEFLMQREGKGNQILIAKSSNNQLFLMVHCMEAWFLADKDALEAFYDKRYFKSKKWADKPEIEIKTKKEVFDLLYEATKDSPKGAYTERTKVEQGFSLIERIDPNKVAECSPHFQRLLTRLNDLLCSAE